jgi:microcystin degradation protein MlrC
MMRIAIGAIAHESSSFTPVVTPYEAFSVYSRGLLRGGEVIDGHRGVNTGAGGFIAGAEAHKFELVPLMWTFAEPSGPVETDAWRRLKSEFLDRLAEALPVDGVLLDLHGAMVIEDIEDGEGDLLAGVREVIGNGPPVIATLDLHGNITQQMCDAATVLIPCDNYPHTDFMERGLEAAAMIAGTLRGEVHPVMAWRQLPMLWTGGQYTGRQPFDSIIARVHELEDQPGILTASVAPGFPWADIYDAGSSVIVVADGDSDLASREAEALGQWIFDQRDKFLPDLESWGDVLSSVGAADRWPVVIGDPQDNPGGGAPGDSVGMLKAFLDAGLTNALIVTVCDPEVVDIAQQAGERAEITVDIGGKSAPEQGPPVHATAIIERLLDLRFEITGPMYTGMVQDFGAAALLRIGGVHVAVVTHRLQVFDLTGPRMLGFDPESLSWIGVKSANHFRGAYEPIAGSVHRVAFPAQHRFDPRKHTYTRIRRPIWPLDQAPV